MPIRSLGLLVLAMIFPAFAYAAAVNINTADAALLDTLPGIGLAKAGAIIKYRQEHGAFVRIEDIQNVNGIGSGSTYEKIAPFITVGETGATPATSDNADAPASAAPPPSPSGTATYTPPPSALSVDVRSDGNAILEVPLHLSAEATTKNGAIDSAARLLWSFGDGSQAEGNAVEKTYRYAGTYLVVVTATDGSTVGRGEMIVTARSAQVRISGVSPAGITVANDASERLDLSGWRFLTEDGIFRIPNGTTLLPRSNVLFPFTISNLPIASAATLTYPSGVVAARYVPPPVAVAPLAEDDIASGGKPSASSTGFNTTQTVEPALVSEVSGTAHETATVSAPAAATELAAAGAASLGTSSPPQSGGAGRAAQTGGLLHSPWILGLIGIITVAGGAFIFL